MADRSLLPFGFDGHDVTPRPEQQRSAGDGRSRHADLAESGGKIYGDDRAAALLELNPTTLQSKMQRLGV